MDSGTQLRIGVIGSVIAMLCCFTPILVVTLGALGLAGLVGMLDYVLFPVLLLFLGLTAHAAFRRKRGP